MSIAEYGAPTKGEIAMLLIARAQCGRVMLDGGNEAELRAMARRLVARGFGEMFANHRGEFFRANSKAVRFLSDHLEKQVGA